MENLVKNIQQFFHRWVGFFLSKWMKQPNDPFEFVKVRSSLKNKVLLRKFMLRKLEKLRGDQDNLLKELQDYRGHTPIAIKHKSLEKIQENTHEIENQLEKLNEEIRTLRLKISHH